MRPAPIRAGGLAPGSWSSSLSRRRGRGAAASNSAKMQVACSSISQAAVSTGRRGPRASGRVLRPGRGGGRAAGVGGCAASAGKNENQQVNIAKVGKQWKYSGGEGEGEGDAAQGSARARAGRAKILNASWDRNGGGIVCESLPRGQYRVKVVSMEQLLENAIEEDELNKNNADLKVKFSPEGLLEIAGPFLKSDMTEIAVESLEDVCNGLSSASSTLACPLPLAVDAAPPDPLPLATYSGESSPEVAGEVALSRPFDASSGVAGSGSLHPMELSISGRPINRA